jgi:ubiquinone/menaquinone biosynthesis C-methylase UbiE
VSLYGRLFAALYERFLSASEEAGLSERRSELLANANGRVLEIGAGTGLNLGRYPESVEELVLTEPEEPMARRLEKKLDGLGPLRGRASVIRAPAEALPFEDDSFDTAVSTLVLCTVEDPVDALSEIARVLKPGGQLLFLEHVRSEEPRLGRWQDTLQPLWKRFGHGCVCNRRTSQLLEASRLRVDEIDHGDFPKAPPLVRPLIVGRAVAT